MFIKKYPNSKYKKYSDLNDVESSANCNLWARTRNQCNENNNYADPTWSNCEKTCVGGAPHGCIISKHNNNVYWNSNTNENGVVSGYKQIKIQYFSALKVIQ